MSGNSERPKKSKPFSTAVEELLEFLRREPVNWYEVGDTDTLILAPRNIGGRWMRRVIREWK